MHPCILQVGLAGESGRFVCHAGGCCICGYSHTRPSPLAQLEEKEFDLLVLNEVSSVEQVKLCRHVSCWAFVHALVPVAAP